MNNLAVFRDPKLLLPLLLVLAGTVLGGASGYYPIRAEFIAAASIGLLIYTMWTWRGPAPTLDVTIWMPAVLLLPLLYLVPLPPELWQMLPGRETLVKVAAFIGSTAWRPLSISPGDTMRFWLALFLPCSIFLAALRLSQRELISCAWAIVALATLSTALGILQISTGGGYLFASAQNNFPLGFFSNRNHQAAMGYVGVTFALALAMRARALRSAAWLPTIAIAVILSANVVVTNSRAGIALLCFCLLASLLALFHRTHGRTIAAVAAIGMFLGFLVTRSDIGQHMIARFASSVSDERSVIWPQAIYGISAYFPTGSGFGTFDTAYQAIEPLDSISPALVNHAHNDFLEIALEGGIAAIVLVLAFLGAFFWKAAKAFQAERLDDATLLARAAVIASSALILHSITDYALRTYALLGIFALALAMIWAPAYRKKALAAAADGSQSDAGNSAFLHAAIVLLGILAGGMLLAATLADHGPNGTRARSSVGDVAELSDAATVAAEKAVRARQYDSAAALAVRSLQDRLQNSRALRVIGEVAAAQGRPAEEETAMLLAARLSWRDGFAQYWLLKRALAGKDYVMAGYAADALLRTDFHAETVMPQVLGLLRSGEGRTALIDRLKTNPPWADQFFNAVTAHVQRNPTDVTAFVTEFGRSGGRLPKRQAEQLIDAALTGGDEAGAISAWQQMNGGIDDDPRSGIVDGDFRLASVDDERFIGPFGWTFPSASRQNLASTIDAAKGNGLVLRVSTFPGRGGVAASQQTLLPTGRYLLRYFAEPSGQRSANLRVSLRCNGGANLLDQPAIEVLGTPPLEQSLPFVIPGGCPRQTLQILARGLQTKSETSISNITVQKP